jgi:hypothetical protein
VRVLTGFKWLKYDLYEHSNGTSGCIKAGNFLTT